MHYSNLLILLKSVFEIPLLGAANLDKLLLIFNNPSIYLKKSNLQFKQPFIILTNEKDKSHFTYYF